MCGMLSHFSRVWHIATLWTVAHQAPLTLGFSRQEYWSGLPCPSQGDLPNIESASASSGRFFTTSATWEGPSCHTTVIKAGREVSPCTVPSIRRKPVLRPICRITFAFSFWGCHIPSSKTIIENEHRNTVIDVTELDLWAFTSWPHQGGGEGIIKPGLFQDGRRREKVNYSISYTFPPTTSHSPGLCEVPHLCALIATRN